MARNLWLHVVGNGPGVRPPMDENVPFVAFNQSADKSLRAGEIRINNRKIAGAAANTLPFVVSSRYLSAYDCEQLQDKLNTTSEELCSQLGCLPSAGFTAVFALTGMGVGLQLFQMPLRPSLLRVNTMPIRQPLAAAFHNWLGERRLAWQLLRDRRTLLNWPQLYLPTEPTETIQDIDISCPRLQEWFVTHAGRPEKGDISTLQELASLPAMAWCQGSKADILQAFEGYFFLVRQQQTTPNWWLYRNDISSFIDTLLLRLMQAQQHLLAVD